MEEPLNKTLSIPVTGGVLPGNLTLPPRATGLVIFAHGSGSSRLSPRNRRVAAYLNNAGFATLLFDLLTELEDRVYANRFDIDLLTERLVEVTRHVHALPALGNLPLGYFGASTGAAAALGAAAQLGEDIRSVVSRGGRPDLAMDWLADIDSAVLLIVGELDLDVLELNRQALAALRCRKALKVVDGATHLFEEPGTLQVVSESATEWFRRTLIPQRAARPVSR